MPHYRKPVHVEIEQRSVDFDQVSDTSQTSLVQSIKSRVSSFWNRMLGRSTERVSGQ